MRVRTEYERQVKAAQRAEKERLRAESLDLHRAIVRHRAAYIPLHKTEKSRKIREAREERQRNQGCDCCSAADIAAFIGNAHALGLEVDHKLALGLGGAHCVKNMQALTAAEHAIKTAEDLRAMKAGRIRSDIKHRFAGRPLQNKTVARLIPVVA